MTARNGATRMFALAMIAGLALAAAACGDDDSETARTGDPSTESGSGSGSGSEDGGDPAALATTCDAYIGVTTAFNGAPEGAEEFATYFDSQVSPLLDTLEATPFPLVDGSLGLMVDSVRSLGEVQDFQVFETEEFMAAQTEVDGYVFENCSFEHSAEVTAVDYGFEGAADTLPAGETAFRLENGGNEMHEMVVARKADGVTESWDELLAMPEEESESKVEFAGGAFAPTKGAISLAVMDLAPGDYVMACFIPTGSVDGEEGSGPPHFTEGMVHEFTVE
jgi:hypothetical protein